MATADQIRAALTVLHSCYGPRFPNTPGALAAWSLALEDIEADELVGAVRAWIKTNEWPPVPAQLVDLVPRFCSCGKCSACFQRSLERARAAVERGAAGSDLEQTRRLPGAVPFHRSLPPRHHNPSSLS